MTNDACNVYEIAGYRLDAAKRVLTKADGTPVPLMPKAFDTLLLLVENAGRTVSKDEILAQVWPNTIVEENNLTQNISALRKLFGEKPSEHRFIVTVPGRGYRLVAPVGASLEPAESQARATAVAEAPRHRSVAGPREPRRILRLSVATVGFVGAALIAVIVYVLAGFGETPPSRIRSLAVLPFKPLVEERRNEALEYGMADSLIALLGKSPDLVVRPLNATRRFGSLDQDPIAAGRILGVDAVVDGTVHVANDRVRATTRILRVADGRQMLSEQYDERFADIFSVQDSIAQRVADSFEIRLAARGRRYEPKSTEAYELYMNGRLHASRLVAAEVRKGVDYYERAILADPTYALPHAGIAQAQRSLVLSNDVRALDVMPRGKIAALRAVELAPELAEAHYGLGMINFFFDWSWTEAESRLRRAVDLDPGNAEAQIYLAHLYSNLGRKAEALYHAGRARELNPAAPLIRALEGQFLGHQGEIETALDRLRSAVDLDPSFWLSHHLLANALVDQGGYEEAIGEAAEAARLSPVQTYSDAIRGLALARLGRRGEAESVLHDLLRAERERYVPPTHIAMMHMALGDNERAIAYLEAAVEGRDARIAFLKIEPKWDELRSERGFIDLMSQLRFP